MPVDLAIASVDDVVAAVFVAAGVTDFFSYFWSHLQSYQDCGFYCSVVMMTSLHVVVIVVMVVAVVIVVVVMLRDGIAHSIVYSTYC